MTIKVYESIMPGEPVEVYDDHGVTVEQWVKGKTRDYQRGSVQPVSCAINGAIVQPLGWADVVIGACDNVEFRVVPRGGSVGDFLSVALPFWGGSLAASEAIIGSFIPDVPGQSGMGQQGSRITPADARANTARLSEAVPELLGQYIRYPDYVSQPRRLYVDTKTQELRLMLCVGVGSYEIDPATIKVGETPIEDIQGASYEIFEPGASVSGTPNHENWYTAPEVGGTQASAGIRLRGITLDERSYSGPSAVGTNKTLSNITVGERWAQGNRGSIKMQQAITVSGNLITGNFQHLAVGLTVNVESDVAVNGTYVVATLNGAKTELELETTGGSPVTPTSGGGFMSVDKAGTEYLISAPVGSTSIIVDRVLTGGDPDPDWTEILPQATFASVDIVWLGETFSGGQVGPFAACPEGETTRTVEVDVFAPQGLGTIDGENVNSRSRTITLKWRPVGGNSWTSQNQTVSGATRDQLGWTFSLNIPAGIRPEIQIDRVGAEDTALEALDRLEITALRSRLPTVTSYADVTTMAITITGSDDIASASNNRVNMVATRKLEPVGGGTESATRSISRAACYVARSLGYDNDQLDIAEFERLENLWSSRGDTFDYVFGGGTAKDAIDTILRAGFAEMTLDNGVITPVRDEPRTQLEDGYSPENMTAPLRRQFSGKQPDEADGVEVEYTNADTWTTETVMCTLPGDQQIKVDKIKPDGVTDSTRAWRIGMRRRRAQRYRRWT